jgi:phosphate transport system substrate-binding protein
MPSLRLHIAIVISVFMLSDALARERIQITGAMEVLDYIQPVAEQYARHWGEPVPSMEVTGTGSGIRLFCSGPGLEHPDMVATSRRMTGAERKHCLENGVTRITEIEIGRDAMVMVHAGDTPPINLGTEQLFAALAAEVELDGALGANSSKYWNDIDNTLPLNRILVMLPRPNTTAAMLLQDLALPEGCKKYTAIQELDDPDRQRICRTLRQDSRVVNAARRDDRMVVWLHENTNGYAITDFDTYRSFADRLEPNMINGVLPSTAMIASKRYPLVSSLYVYVKDQHAGAITGLQKLLYELTSERAMSPDGYMAGRGLVTLDAAGRNRARSAALGFGM